MRDKTEKSNNRKRRVRVFPIVLTIIILLLAALLVDSNMRIVTTDYELGYKNLPKVFDGFRIVVLSDIHSAEFGINNERLIEKTEAAEPDIIVIVGDFIDGYKRPPAEKQLEIAKMLVSGLSRIAPIYYITGNHDWNSDKLRPLITLLEERGVQVLRNKYTLLEEGGEAIVLAGTDDPNGPADMIKPEELVGHIKSAEGDRFIVMLEHRNHNLELYSGLGVDLVLSGHSHGGIIRLPFTDGLLGTQRDWFPTYTNGVYAMGDTKMLVSRGLGNHTGLPRFLNNPHIAVAVLRNVE